MTAVEVVRLYAHFFSVRPWHDVTRSAAMTQLAHARNMIRNTDPPVVVAITFIVPNKQLSEYSLLNKEYRSKNNDMQGCSTW